MNKILKITGLLVGGIILIVLLGLGALAAFVSPNMLKPMIAEQVFKATGRQLVIDGNLSWTVFPYLAVHIGHASLSNPSQFQEKTFAEIDHAKVGIKVLPLLHSSIETSDIFLSGLKVNFIKNADGQSNWQIMQQSKPAGQPEATAQPVPGSKNKLYFKLQIPIVKIEKATITWTNAKNSQNVEIDDFHFLAKDISFDHSFPITADFKINGKSPALSGDVTLDGDLTINPAADKSDALQALTYKGNMKIDSLQAGKLKATKISVDTLLDKGILNFPSISADFYQGTLKAQAKADLNASPTPISLQAKLDGVQLQPLLQEMEKQHGKYQFKGVTNIDLQATTNGDDAIKNLNGSGNFSLKDGVLEGVNIGAMIDNVVAIMKGKSPPAAGENLTNFGDVVGTLKINDGVVSNNDLKMTSPRFNTTGQGTIDLVNQRINYNLSAKPSMSSSENQGLLNNLLGVDFNGLVFPIYITGSLEDPNVSVDRKAIVNYVTQQKIKSLPGNVEKVITNKIPQAAGSLLKGIFGK